MSKCTHQLNFSGPLCWSSAEIRATLNQSLVFTFCWSRRACPFTETWKVLNFVWKGSRHSCMKVVGEEKGRPTEFLSDLIPKLLGGDSFTKPLVIHRAHCTQQHKPSCMIIRGCISPGRLKILQLRKQSAMERFESAQQGMRVAPLRLGKHWVGFWFLLAASLNVGLGFVVMQQSSVDQCLISWLHILGLLEYLQLGCEVSAH